MKRDVDEAIVRQASRRSGAFTRRDVVEVGGDRALVARRLAAGSWSDHGHGVLTLRGHRAGQDQARWVALLAAGSPAHLSHETAADLLDLAGVTPGTIAVTVPPDRKLERLGVSYHRMGDVRPHHRATVAGFPSTSPARAIVDLASVLPPAQLSRALEDVVVRRLASFGRIASVLRDVRRQGKPGIGTLVDVLADLDGVPPPASDLERLLHTATRLASVDAIAQAPLPSRPQISGLVDLAVPASRLILEADGRRWHTRQTDMARDRQRDREAARSGWLTLRFVHSDLTDDMCGCVDDIRTTHQNRLADKA